MESQPQNPEFRNNPEKFHTCAVLNNNINPYQNVSVYITSNSYAMVCSPVRGDNVQALASGLSHIQVGSHGLTFYTVYISVDMAHYDFFFVPKLAKVV